MNNLTPFSLVNKTILITGASSGIGKQCAIACANMGAKVILLGRNLDRLKQTQKQLTNLTDSQLFSFDLTNSKKVEHFVQELKTANISINGIIHAAGISTTLPFRLSTIEKQDLFFNTNVSGPINLTRQLSKKNYGLIEGASIIFIASVMAHVGEVGKTLYGMTKGALVSATKSIALELAPRKIRVNTVSPGVVNTPMSAGATYSRDSKALDKIIALHPLGLGQVDDIANACTYLLSDAAKWVTGTNLIIDGGYTAR